MVSGAITPARRAANILFLLLPPLLPAALAFFQVVNGDIGFHVATGRYIDLAGKLPDSNVLSFAQPDHPWVLHQFLPAWLFHRVELAFGRDMLVAVKAVLVYLTFLFLWDAITRRIRSRGEGWESRISGSRGDVHRLSTDGAGTGHGSGAGTIDLLALGGWLFALAAGAAACRFFVRPFLFSDLGLAVLLAVLARYEQDRRPVRLVQAALVTGAFAPLHAGVIYMLLVLVAFAAGQAGAWAIGRWQARRGPIGHEVTGRSSGRTFGGTDTSGGTGNSSGEVDQEGPSPVRFPWGPVLLLPGALAAAAVALAVSDPSGIEALTLPFRFSVHPYFHEHLAEFRPFPFDLARYPFAWGLVAMTAGMGVGMVFVRWKGRRTVGHVGRRPSDTSDQRTEVGHVGHVGRRPSDGWTRDSWATGLVEVLLLGGFTLLLLRHQRAVFEYALVAAFVLARWTGALLARNAVSKTLRNLLLVAAALLSNGALAHQYSTARFGLGVDDRFFPARIFSFVRQHDLPDPAYVSDAWGGHWLWEFYPERRVFYDNRLEAYSFEFFRDVYQSIRYGEPGWQEKLDAHGIETMVLKYTTPGERKFQEGRPNIRDLAFSSSQWGLVFWDDLGMVYVRQGPGLALRSLGEVGSGVGGRGPGLALRSLGEVGSAACRTCFRFARFNPDTLVPVAGWEDPDLGRELRQAFALAPGERSGYALTTWLLRHERRPEAAGVLTQALQAAPDSPLLTGLAETLAEGR